MTPRRDRWTVPLPDGLWRVETERICAGFVVKDGRVTACAPILRRFHGLWASATRIAS